jgi:RpiR family carbohydrate utilization transcriptional regulator
MIHFTTSAISPPPRRQHSGTAQLDAARSSGLDALRAKKILFVGVGGAASICDEAVHLFIKAGSTRLPIAMVIPRQYAPRISPRQMSWSACRIPAPRIRSRLFYRSRDNGATTIAITSDPTSPVAKRPT